MIKLRINLVGVLLGETEINFCDSMDISSSHFINDASENDITGTDSGSTYLYNITRTFNRKLLVPKGGSGD